MRHTALTGLSLQQRKSRQRGVTLVELLVAMLISAIVVVAVMQVQGTLTRQKVRSADVGVRDNEARAALDTITRDVTSAGFLLGGSHLPCAAIYTYNANNTSTLNGSANGLYKRLPVDAFVSSSGAAMPFAPTLVLNYPPTGTRSDVLVVSGAVDSQGFSSAKSPAVAAFKAPDFDPLETGELSLVTTLGLTEGNVGVLRVSDRAQHGCMRVPLSDVGDTASGVPQLKMEAGTLMPETLLKAFATAMQPPAFTGPLSSAQLMASATVVDIGAPKPAAAASVPVNPPPPPRHTAIAYYIDGSGQWPVLMRAHYSLLDDTLLPGSPQPIAAGVLSLQVLFGVDPGGAGRVTDYQTGAQVQAAGTEAIRSVRIAMVNHTLLEDVDAPPAAANAKVAIPQSLLANQTASFSDVPIPASLARHRFSLHEVELAVRNCLWSTCQP